MAFRNLYSLFFLVLGFGLTQAQQFQLVDSIQLKVDGQITDFSVDDFNNLYYINNSIIINKIDFKTRKTKSYSNRNILEDLDTQNILQITLKSGFFKLLILDNQLNPVQDLIDFSNNTAFSPTLIALVDTNYLWGFDPAMQRLFLWNYRDNIILRQSVIINSNDPAEFFSKLIYNSNKIYLISTQRILKFDEFGNLEKVIPVGEHEHIQLFNQSFYYSKENQIFRLDMKTGLAEKIDGPKEFDFFSINANFLFVLKNKVIYLYKSQK